MNELKFFKDLKEREKNNQPIFIKFFCKNKLHVFNLHKVSLEN
jgi:hypothetical protein